MSEITTRKAAQRLGISQRTVVRYVNIGLISARRAYDPDGPWLVDTDEVDRIQVGRARTPAFLKSA